MDDIFNDGDFPEIPEIPDDMPEELKEKLLYIKEKMLMDRVSSQIVDLGSFVMGISGKFKSKTGLKTGNMLLLIGGLCKNEEDLDELEDVITEFTAKKMREALSDCDSSVADELFDKIDEMSKMFEDGDKLKEDFFQVIEGKKKMSDIKKENGENE